MSNKKLNLPAEVAKNAGMATVSPALPVVDTGIRAASEITQAKIEANAKVEVAKLQVCKEAIVTIQSFCDVFKSHKELQKTCVEWEGRIREAEIDVQKAEANLQAIREQNKPKMEELAQSGEVLKRLLSLFDDFMEKAKAPDLPDDDKKEVHQYLLQLSDKIVQLKK